MLVLKISLNFSPNTGHKEGEFFETLSEKSFELVPSRKDGTVIFNLGLVLLPAKVDSIPEERGCKGDALGACGIDHIKTGIALFIEVVALYVEANIVEVKIPSLEWPILECGVYLKLAILLVSNKQF